MNVDDVAKIVLAFSCSVGLLAVCFSLAKLLLNISSAVQDTRAIVVNASEVTELMTQDYMGIRNTIKNFANGMTFISTFAEFVSKQAKRSK